MNAVIYAGLPIHDQEKIKRYGLKKSDLNALLTFLCEEFNITYEELRSRVRTHETHIYPRRLFYYFATEYFTYTPLKTLGMYFNQDHATVVHSIKRVRDLYRFPNDPLCIRFKKIEERMKKTI